MKRKKILIMLGITIITLMITGITYAYYSANIRKINQTETMVKTNELNITYTGGQEINAGSMIPGDSFTKTFRVENTSSKAVTFNIYMENITNEFNEDLVFSLSDEEGILLNQRVLPITSTEKKYLKANISIDTNQTKNYILTVEYKYLPTKNQNEHQGSVFNATVGIDTEQNAKAGAKGTIMAALNSSSSEDSKYFWHHRENITKIVLENTLSPKEDATYSYDVSEGQDKSVMSYLIANEENPETYTLYLQGEGSIKANENSNNLFYKFTNLATIEGLEYLDTSNVITMHGMFCSCKKLTTLDLSHFNTSNVVLMTNLFYVCENLTNLNISNFDTSKVTNMQGMFGDCKNLTTLNVSSFNTENVTNMTSMFSNCLKLTTLNLSNFDMHNVTGTYSMVVNMPSIATIYVKDEYAQNKILSSSLRPSVWTTDNIIIAS